MKIVRLASIEVPAERQRQEFRPEAIQELADSIEAFGLFHPPVAQYQNFNQSDKLWLRLGERRLRAITLLAEKGISFYWNAQLVEPGFIPIAFLHELNELQLKEAELEENIRRVDLSWQEKARAIAEIHALKQKQFGEKNLAAVAKGEKTPEKTGWGITDTEEMLKNTPISGGRVRPADMIALAKHVDDPDVAKAENPKEAMKILRRKATEEFEAALSKQLVTTGGTRVKLYHEDATLWMAVCEDEQFDVILTDPPYGWDADKFGSQSDLGHDYEDSEKAFVDIITALASDGYRIAKAQAHLYTFLDFRMFKWASDTLAQGGWEVWPKPIFWDKGAGMLPQPHHGPRYTYECILYALKGRRPVTAVFPDVIRINSLDAKTLTYAAEKPVAVFVDLLKRSCSPGDTVFDPCVGSGTIFPAAKKLKLEATGCEKLEKAFNKALVRAQQQED